MTQIVTENVVFSRHLMSFWFPWFQRQFCRYLEVLPQSALDVKFDWLGPQESLLLGVARSIPDIRSCFKCWMLLCFAFSLEVQTPFCCGESNWVRRKSRRLDASTAVMDFPDFTIEDGVDEELVRLWYYGKIIPYLNWSLKQFIHFHTFTPQNLEKRGFLVSFEALEKVFLVTFFGSQSSFEADRHSPRSYI